MTWLTQNWQGLIDGFVPGFVICYVWLNWGSLSKSTTTATTTVTSPVKTAVSDVETTLKKL